MTSLTTLITSRIAASQPALVSEPADFLEANVEAGKTYYIVVDPRIGAFSARFSLYPVRTDGATDYHTESKKFLKIQKKAKPTTLTEDDREWYEKRRCRKTKP